MVLEFILILQQSANHELLRRRRAFGNCQAKDTNDEWYVPLWLAIERQRLCYYLRKPQPVKVHHQITLSHHKSRISF